MCQHENIFKKLLSKKASWRMIVQYNLNFENMQEHDKHQVPSAEGTK